MTFLNSDALSADHAFRLQWFQDNAGMTTGFPRPLRDGLLLTSAPKGIYKPRDMKYALSIRLNLESKYQDGVIAENGGDHWSFAYHQEHPDPKLRDKQYPNVGLMECIKDQIPVGVLQEVERAGRSSAYKVVGLAVPVRWVDGYFYFDGLTTEGRITKGDTFNEVVLAAGESDPEPPVPDSDYDARVRIARQLVARRGQRKFRGRLLTEYARACSITGSTVEAVLEAAHIRPYRGDESDTPANGLLLRADVHTLFDLYLVAIEPVGRTVTVSDSLAETEYAELQGRQLREPINAPARPSDTALMQAWEEFLIAEDLRR